MKKLNPEYVEIVNRLTNQSPYFTLMSMKIVDVGMDYSVLEIDIEQKHLQPFGLVHGGVFASIIDAATFWAIFYGIKEADAGLTSVDLKLNYLGPVSAGRLFAKGRQIKLGRTLGYADATVLDDNNQIMAHGSSTLMVLPGKGLHGSRPLPPKFL